VKRTQQSAGGVSPPAPSTFQEIARSGEAANECVATTVNAVTVAPKRKAWLMSIVSGGFV